MFELINTTLEICLDKPPQSTLSSADWLFDGGEMGKLIRSMDWSKTPLGPLACWPQTLRVAVGVCIASRFPMHVCWGPDLIYIYNDAHAPILGGRHPAALGRPAPEIWHDIWPVIGPQFDAVLHQGESTWNENVRVVTGRNGYEEDAWFTWSYSPIRDESGKIDGLFCAAREETAKVLAECSRDKNMDDLAKAHLMLEMLASEEHARLAAIVESSDDAIIGKTLDGIVTSWNAGAERLFGYSAAEATGKPILLIIPLERHAEEADILSRLRNGERIRSFETVRIAKNGTPLQVSITSSPIKDRTGKIIGASKIARDITARKLAEENIARQAEKLARSNVELERFAFVTSHDLQEPMRTVRSFSQLLQRRYQNALEGDGGEYLRFIHSGVERMQTLINDLLSYSRVDSQGAAFGPADCNQIMSKVLQDMMASIRDNDVQITVGELPTLIADATQMGQVFQNLLSNAIKFHGSRRPEIRLSAKEAANEWHFAVRDNGIGIAPEYFDRIFVIFQRLHTIQEYGGTGIGLAICKQIVERHGGRIWVESEPGEGSVFHFTILKK